MELTTDWLNRTGQHLLTVDLSIDLSVDLMPVKPRAYPFFVKIVNQYASRFFSLLLRAPPSMFPLFTNLKNATALNTLVVVSDPSSEYALDLGPQIAPALLILQGVRLASLVFDWTSLTHFASTGSFYVDELFQLLALAPNLTNCEHISIRSRTTGTRTKFKSFIHHNLESFTVNFYCEETDKVLFFRKATLRQLSRLNCNFCEGYLPVTTFANFLDRSSCPLQDLTLRQLIVPGEDLVQVLRLAPCLTTLYFAPVLKAPLFPLDAFYSELCISRIGSPFLHFLQKLTILPGPVFPWHLLPSFFRGNGGVEDTAFRPLKDIQIKCLPMVPWINDNLFQILEPSGIIDDRKILDEFVNLEDVNLSLQMQQKYGLIDMIELSSRVLDAYDRKGSSTLTEEEEEYETNQDSLVQF